MLFSSLLFICIFFPLCLFTYYIPKSNSARNIVLLVFSLIFYAWGEPKYIFLLLFSAFSCWFYAQLIEKFKNENKERDARRCLIAACAVIIGLLVIFKYTPFLLGNLKALTGVPKTIKNVALPIGISFYTLQLITYVADVYKGEARAQKNFANLLLYACLFHKCIAGPIVKYSDIENELTERTVSMSDFNKGVMRFSVGLAKKAILANSCGTITNALLLSDAEISSAAMLSMNLDALSSASVITLWFGMLIFMLQIYLDFSAYSDIAIGMGLMMGFHYNENFNYPYAASSVSEFWKKWNITLGAFFKDYVYIPLGGNRNGKIRTVLNLLIVWLLTGLWHGASWSFVLWGLYFFVFIAAEKLFLSDLLKKAPSWVRHIYLLAVVYFGWIFFRFENMSLVGTVFKGMFGLNGNAFATREAFLYIFDNLIFVIIAAVACTPVIRYLKAVINHFSKKKPAVNIAYSVFRAVIPAILVLISAACLTGISGNPFLYFRF